MQPLLCTINLVDLLEFTGRAHRVARGKAKQPNDEEIEPWPLKEATSFGIWGVMQQCFLSTLQTPDKVAVAQDSAGTWRRRGQAVFRRTCLFLQSSSTLEILLDIEGSEVRPFRLTRLISGASWARGLLPVYSGDFLNIEPCATTWRVVGAQAGRC